MSRAVLVAGLNGNVSKNIYQNWAVSFFLSDRQERLLPATAIPGRQILFSIAYWQITLKAQSELGGLSSFYYG